MIDTVYSVKKGDRKECLFNHCMEAGIIKWKCGHCKKGIVWTIQHFSEQRFSHTDKCAVCKAIIKVTEISR